MKESPETRYIIDTSSILSQKDNEPHRCRVVRLGDSRERKKRPHLVKNQISKSLKELFK